MHLDDVHATLLSIMRRSLWKSQEKLPTVDWQSVEETAQKQGVLSLLYLGVNQMDTGIPYERVRMWRGAMLAGVLRNEQLNAEQQVLLKLLNERSIRAVILKGTSVARFYPYPDARCLGDIDLLIDSSSLTTVDQILRVEGYRRVVHDHEFHISYLKGEITVEVHYAASDVPNKAGGKAAQTEMSNFLNCAHLAVLDDMEFPVLCDSHQALMQLLHMERHMMDGGIGFRQLCDWAVFVAKSDANHWCGYSVDMLKKCGLFTYASVITKTCVRYLGLDKEKTTWCLDVSDSLVDEFMLDVFRGGDMGKADVENSSDLFTNRSTLGDENQNAIKGMITTLNKLSYKSFPITKKYKILLPFCWMYLPARYIVRSFLGLRPKKNVLSAVGASNKRYSLYKKLHLYEVN